MNTSAERVDCLPSTLTTFETGHSKSIRPAILALSLGSCRFSFQMCFLGRSFTSLGSLGILGDRRRSGRANRMRARPQHCFHNRDLQIRGAHNLPLLRFSITVLPENPVLSSPRHSKLL